MKDLLRRVIEEEEWKPLRFTVYNFLEENERYQMNLEKLGYESGYDDLECKTFGISNYIAKQFKTYVEKHIQKGEVIIAVCVLEDRDYFTIVKPKGVDITSVLGVD